MSAEQIHFFLTLRNQVKLYHWSTASYARHKATDEAVSRLDEHIDKYVEVYLGKRASRPRLTGANATIKLTNMTEAGAVKLVHAALRYLQGPLTRSLGPADSDLANIRDEMIADLNQLLYLFRLD